jgi:hypothetical protein
LWQVAASAGPARTAPSAAAANFNAVLRIVQSAFAAFMENLSGQSAECPARVKVDRR